MKNIILIILMMCFLSVYALDKTETSYATANNITSEVRTEQKNQLEELTKLLNTSRNDAAILLSKMSTIKDDAEKKRIQINLDKINAEIDELILSIEKIAVGKLEQDLFTQAQNKGFNWQNELEEIVKPIIFELKSMTERPRKIEALRSKKKFYEERLPISVHALKNISEINELTISPELKRELKKIANNWRKVQADIENKIKITQFELNQLLAPKPDENKDTIQSIRLFLSGRGLSLILALGAFSLSLYVMRRLYSLYERRLLHHRKNNKGFATRLLKFLFSALSITLAMILAMSVLSFRGDWYLLGLLLIFLISSGLALRGSIPQFFQEIKILLNIGTVREDERVIYNGLPWKISELGVYSTLINPMLTGGQVRLTLGELAKLKSRPTSDKERWFPTRENDFILLDGTIYGRVIIQTPEYVELKVSGSIQTFSVQNFLANNPRNLSIEGFTIMIQLGLDYRHQSKITTHVIDELDKFMNAKLQKHVLAANMTEFLIDFNGITASSLNIAIIAKFNGNAADSYHSIRRLLNKLSVDACNHFHWTIPYNQLSLHLEEPIKFNASKLLDLTDKAIGLS